MMKLAEFDNSWYDPGRSRVTLASWFFIGSWLLSTRTLPFYALKRAILRLFGARVGMGVVIKPGVKIKYPWMIELGDDSWVGEDVWFDNLAPITVADNCCISQGAYLCTGNHDYRNPQFTLVVAPIRLERCVWVGAKAIICPGVTIEKGGIALAGSVITKNIGVLEIHGGNPGTFLRHRTIQEESREHLGESPGIGVGRKETHAEAGFS